MNGFVLGTWLESELNMQREGLKLPGAFNLAHNVNEPDQVSSLIDRLASFRGRIRRQADAPPHGGFRGYVADPDDHGDRLQSAWRVDERGLVTFGL
ncbi:hypothetical protein D3C73_909120 [compost metagenome]